MAKVKAIRTNESFLLQDKSLFQNITNAQTTQKKMPAGSYEIILRQPESTFDKMTIILMLVDTMPPLSGISIIEAPSDLYLRNIQQEKKAEFENLFSKAFVIFFF